MDMSTRNVGAWCPWKKRGHHASMYDVLRRAVAAVDDWPYGDVSEDAPSNAVAVRVTRALTGTLSGRMNKRAVERVWWTGPDALRGLALAMFALDVCSLPNLKIVVEPVPDTYEYASPRGVRYDENESGLARMERVLRAFVATLPSGEFRVDWGVPSSRKRKRSAAPERRSLAVVVPEWTGSLALRPGVCMHLGGEHIRDRLVELIDAETSCVTGIMAWMSDDAVIDALAGARARGVSVHVVVQREADRAYFAKYHRVEPNKVHVEGVGTLDAPAIRVAGLRGSSSGRPNVHAKLMCFVSQTLVWHGSFNATKNGLESLDQACVIETPDLAPLLGKISRVLSVSDVC